MMRSKAVAAFLTVALILASAAVFQNPNNQGINWTFPYFSGAANFERLFDWQISPSDYAKAVKLSGPEYRRYKHEATADTVSNAVNNYGYVLVALSSQTIFPWMGDLQGVIVLQLVVHLSVCLFLILAVFQTPLQRLGFLCLYAANPLIVYFVTFPFYYFWMFIPATALVILWFRPNWRTVSLPILTPFLLLSILIRPTTVFLCAFFYLVGWRGALGRQARRVVLVSIFGFVVGVSMIAGNSSGSPWHPIYVGLGAYSNDQGVRSLSDDEGYNFFKERTGIGIDTNAVAGNFNNPIIRKKYNDALRERYFEIVTERPFLVLRNAVANTLQGFSLGHDVGHRWVSWSSAGLGLCVLGFLVVAKQWIWIISVLSYSAGYAWFFPPIPAYHFGAYLLLVTGVIRGAEDLIQERRDRRRDFSAR